MVGEPKLLLDLAGPVERMKSAKSVMDSFSTRASLGAALILEAEERVVMFDILGDGIGGASAARKLAALAVDVFEVVRGRRGLAWLGLGGTS